MQYVFQMPFSDKKTHFAFDHFKRIFWEDKMQTN